MARLVTFETVRKLALEVPGVEEGAAYGAAAFKLGMLACSPTRKLAEPGSLVVRIDCDNREEFLATEPRTYYLNNHYTDYASVLVRLQCRAR